MLPKVATHIFHTTSRAAAQAVHRNVLQQTGHSTGSNLGAWNGPSSSNWGGHGTGAGSAKHNAGSSRYYPFSTAGRAVSQATAVSANVDGSFTTDENDEPMSRRVVVIQSQSPSPSKRVRIRSSSATLTNAESLGVLKTLQLQNRSRFLHTSIDAAAPSQPALIHLSPSRPRRNSTSSSDGIDRPSSPVRNITIDATVAPQAQDALPPPRPRRNSTSSIEALEKSTLESLHTIVDEQISQQVKNLGLPINDDSPIDPVSSIDAESAFSSESPEASSSRATLPGPSDPPYPYEYLIEARQSADPHCVAEAVARFRSTAQNPRTQDYNNALFALYATREGEPMTTILQLYHDMIVRSLPPDEKTFSVLLRGALDRDYELGHSLIGINELLRRQSIPGGGIDARVHMGLQYKLESVSAEHRENFATILSLYHAARVNDLLLEPRVYLNLIRVCTRHSHLELAEEIFQFFSKKRERLQPFYYRYMIQGYGRVNNITAAERVFQQYIAAGKAGKIVFDHTIGLQKSHILTWNSMIEAYFQCGLPDKAVDVLDKMMNSSADLGFGVNDIPYPASSTYTTILQGFLDAGDVTTAWTWYKRLMEQGVEAAGPFWPSTQPIKPDVRAKFLMVTVLAEHGRITELNKVYESLDLIDAETQTAPLLVYKANMAAIERANDKVAHETLEFLTARVFPHISKLVIRKVMVKNIVAEYLRREMFDEALNSYATFHKSLLRDITVNEESDYTPMALMMASQEAFGAVQEYFFNALIGTNRLTMDFALPMIRFGRQLGIEVVPSPRKHVLHVYALARANNESLIQTMEVSDWEQLLLIALDVESVSLASPSTSAQKYQDVPGYAFQGVFSLLEDMKTFGVDPNELQSSLMNKTIRHLVSVYGAPEVARKFRQELGPVFESVLGKSEEFMDTMASEQKSGDGIENHADSKVAQKLMRTQGYLVVDFIQSRDIDNLLRFNNHRHKVLAAYAMMINGIDDRKVPSPRVMGRLIQSLGRQGEIEKLKEIYGIAQTILDGMAAADPKEDRENWVFVEDNMILGLAHVGDLEGAHAHRLRLLEQGAAPSADAYGALILYLKDTTDDAANAMTLFQEAVDHGIPMNIYLYNNIISKLAKARKADHALELFHRMRDDGVRPSSITYGAVLGACARVGDVQSAETLFEEMENQRNFKPRVPPYNTMMQLYTTIKPNRERVLWYYDKMCQAGINSTSHTYKLLLDAYGSIEPVDIPAMETVFQRLQADPNVDVQGSHYASLINAYGCIQRDLDKAIAIFDSVPSSSTPTQHSVLDAVVFESIVNVLVSHRRTDLIPEYIKKMISLGIHTTAYIVNFLIKGYAINGEIEKAREVFENMVDPPTGVAAPNNHAPHNTNTMNIIGRAEPIYREPSTWEAMVRAELGSGNRDHALDLLERLKSRQYPEAVYNRISGVMVDHSAVLP